MAKHISAMSQSTATPRENAALLVSFALVVGTFSYSIYREERGRLADSRAHRDQLLARYAECRSAGEAAVQRASPGRQQRPVPVSTLAAPTPLFCPAVLQAGASFTR